MDDGLNSLKKICILESSVLKTMEELRKIVKGKHNQDVKYEVSQGGIPMVI